jgi:hypothetical protein
MKLRIGSAIIVSEEDGPQRVTGLDDHEGVESVWYQSMMGDKTGKGPVPVTAVRQQGMMPPAWFGF